MRRRAFASAASGAFALVCACVVVAPVRAEQLQRLHVTSFTLTSDVAHPALEKPFHLVLDIRVNENVKQLDNVQLPVFFGLEELGDEHSVLGTPSGSDYRETLTVVAHQSGTIHVGSAYLDAVDARDGKPKRFISNELSVPVGGGLTDTVQALQRTALNALKLAGVLVLLGIILGITGLMALRRRGARAVAPVPPPPVAPAPVPVAPMDEVRAALAALQAERTRAAALRARGALWRSVGGSDGETLTDVLRRPSAHDPAVRSVLRSAERAAFVQDAYLQSAIEDFVTVLERYTI